MAHLRCLSARAAPRRRYSGAMTIAAQRYAVALSCWVGLAIVSTSYAQAPSPSLPANPAPQPVLSRLVEQAVGNHPSVQAKLAELGGSQASLDSAQWQYYPAFSVQTERGANQTNQAAPNTGSTTLRLQQTLWAGGRLDAGTRNAEFKQQAAQQALQETRTTAALRTVEAWQGLLTAQGRQQATQRLLDQMARLSSMMERRVEQQVSPAIDAQLLRARLAQAQSEYLSAQSGADAARQRLVQWTGDKALSAMALRPVTTAAGTPSAAMQSYEALPTWPTETAQRLDAAPLRSASVLRLEADIQAASEEVRQKQAELWPSVYARVDRQFTDSGSFFGKTASTTAYVGLQYTLGAGLSSRSQVEVAQAKVHSLQSEREALLRQIQDNYASEWRDYQATLERIQYAQLVQTSNATILDSYTRLFVAGRRSWLELLNTLREQNAAEQALTDLQAQQQAGFFRLRLYLGELAWQARALP